MYSFPAGPESLSTLFTFSVELRQFRIASTLIVGQIFLVGQFPQCLPMSIFERGVDSPELLEPPSYRE